MAATRWITGVIACMAVLSGCAEDVADVSDPVVESVSGTTVALALTTDVTPAAPIASVPAPDTPESLDWSAPLIGGGTIEMAGFTGQQVLLWFWAPY